MNEERPEINAVLEHYGATTKHRRSYVTNCVFHEDQTPSLSVQTEDQLFNCKSCGQAGDVYQLIMLKEDTDFVGAREFAAALGLSTGSAGGSDSDVRSVYLAPRRKAPSRKGDRPRHSGYVPAWRRK